MDNIKTYTEDEFNQLTPFDPKSGDVCAIRTLRLRKEFFAEVKILRLLPETDQWFPNRICYSYVKEDGTISNKERVSLYKHLEFRK